MIHNVCVAGCGAMGKQIALNAAIHGFEVALTDTLEKAVTGAEAWATDYLAGRVTKGKMTQETADGVAAKMHYYKTLEEAVVDADLVIEAIIEDQKIKEEFFAKLSTLIREDTIIGCNSSFMPSSCFASFVKNPARLANLHFFNPALVMRLVEVVKGEHTSEETVVELVAFAKACDKDPIRVNKEIDGFIANRLSDALAKEAWFLVLEGYCTPQEVDTAAEKGLGYAMGPFRLQDLVGLDLLKLKLERQMQESGEMPRQYPIMKAKVEAGELGRKSGKGWYEYPAK